MLLSRAFLFLKKGAKEFVDQNMLRSQRSRRRRKQQRSASSNCPGPSESAEEGKQGESDHETTSSSGERLKKKSYDFNTGSRFGARSQNQQVLRLHEAADDWTDISHPVTSYYTVWCETDEKQWNNVDPLEKPSVSF